MVNSMEAVLCTLLFIVPGFIIESFICKVSSKSLGKPSDLLITNITYSAVSSVFASYFIWDMLYNNIYRSHPLKFFIYLGISVFVIPLILGYFLARATAAAESERIKTLLGKLKLNAKGFAPTAWDKFLHSNEFKTHLYASIFLKSGECLRVLFAKNSYAAESNSENVDIYATVLCSVTRDGVPIHESKNSELSTGVLIPQSSINYIVFYGKEESKEGEVSNGK